MSRGNTNSSNISQGIKNRDIGTLEIPNKMLSQYINRAYPHTGDPYSHAKGWRHMQASELSWSWNKLSSNSNANEMQTPMHCGVQSLTLHLTVNGIGSFYVWNASLEWSNKRRNKKQTGLVERNEKCWSFISKEVEFRVIFSLHTLFFSFFFYSYHTYIFYSLWFSFIFFVFLSFPILFSGSGNEWSSFYWWTCNNCVGLHS